MKWLRLYQKIDLFLQITLVLVWLCSIIFKMEEWTLPGYFVVGSFQALSVIIHLFLNHEKGRGRRYVTRITFGLIAYWILVIVSMLFDLQMSFIEPFVFAMLLAQFFLAPVLSVVYLLVCSHEGYRLKKI